MTMRATFVTMAAPLPLIVEPMTIRVLHIIPTLDLGGAEKQLSLLATGRSGHSVDFAS